MKRSPASLSSMEYEGNMDSDAERSPVPLVNEVPPPVPVSTASPCFNYHTGACRGSFYPGCPGAMRDPGMAAQMAGAAADADRTWPEWVSKGENWPGCTQGYASIIVTQGKHEARGRGHVRTAARSGLCLFGSLFAQRLLTGP